MPNLKELLSNTNIDRIDAKILLTHLCQSLQNWPKTALISRDHEELSAEFVSNWHALEKRRMDGEPVAYLIGKKGFYDIELEVNADTLIPRPETEMLVDWAIEKIKRYVINLSKDKSDNKDCFRILDLGTGSGAIALAIANFIQTRILPNTSNLHVEIVGVDQSPGALAMAQKNCDTLGLQHIARFILGSWYSNLDSNERFDLIISNPPYISKNDPHLDQGDLRFEPRSALTDDSDGLDAYRQILNQAPRFLKPHGFIAVEHGFDQGPDLLSLFKQYGLSNPISLQDLAGLDRVTHGQLM